MILFYIQDSNSEIPTIDNTHQAQFVFMSSRSGEDGDRKKIIRAVGFINESKRTDKSIINEIIFRKTLPILNWSMKKIE